jgi:hypothetical protein
MSDVLEVRRGCWTSLVKMQVRRMVWQQLQMEEMRVKLSQLASSLDVFRAIWECSDADQTKLITILWVLWSERNSVNAGDRLKPADETCFQILRHISDFSDYCTIKRDKKAQQMEKWKKPSNNFLKINTDGAFIQQTKTGGWGFIIRDGDGDHVGSGAGHIGAVSDATHAEAYACLQAIQYASDAGIQRVELGDGLPHSKNGAIKQCI